MNGYQHLILVITIVSYCDGLERGIAVVYDCYCYHKLISKCIGNDFILVMEKPAVVGDYGESDTFYDDERLMMLL